MTDPKVSEKEMVEWFDELWESLKVYMIAGNRIPADEDVKQYQAIRAAIEERGRLKKMEEQVLKWQKILKEANEITLFVIKNKLLEEIRDFKLDGEKGEEKS
jgi:predicted MPP superfamily phosphohydrolase